MQGVSNEELVRLIQNNVESRLNYEKLYFQNTGFIYQIVKRYVNDNTTIEDLMQQAFIGLVQAVENYDSSKSDNFLNIFKFYILNSLRELRTEIPEYMHWTVIKYKKMLQDYEKQNIEAPNDRQIINKMGISQEQLLYIKQLLKPVISLDEPIKEDGTKTKGDFLIDKTEDTETHIENEDLKKIIHESIKMLPDSEKNVINKKYFDEKSIKIISEEMNIKYNQAVNLHDNAFKKLRRNRNLKNLIDYSPINEYLFVGTKNFNTTRTSSTEKIFMLREELRRKLGEN